MIRLFFALRPPPPIRELLLDVMDGVPDARWQDEEQLHVTLRFIGEVERPAAEDLAAALEGVVAPAPTVRLYGVGAFGGWGRAGALWAGLAPAEPLVALHRKLDQLCVRVGLPPEGRAFTPHLTVARLPRSLPIIAPEVAAWRARLAALSSDPFTVDRAVLYRSHLGRTGASYEAVATARLT